LAVKALNESTECAESVDPFSAISASQRDQRFGGSEMKDLQRVIYLAATDPDFREKLVDDPKAAVASAGLSLEVDELAAISELRHLIALPSGALVTTILALNPNWLWN